MDSEKRKRPSNFRLEIYCYKHLKNRIQEKLQEVNRKRHRPEVILACGEKPCIEILIRGTRVKIKYNQYELQKLFRLDTVVLRVHC